VPVFAATIVLGIAAVVASLMPAVRAARVDVPRNQIVIVKRLQQLHRTQTELAHVTRVTTLGELTASLSHEVNQPLVAVVGDAACTGSTGELPTSTKRAGPRNRSSRLAIEQPR